jgi:hypothetical protein
MRIEIEINEATMKQIENIMQTRQNRSLEAVLTQIVERGTYNLAYRTQRNREVYQADKQLREEFKAFKATKR